MAGVTESDAKVMRTRLMCPVADRRTDVCRRSVLPVVATVRVAAAQLVTVAAIQALGAITIAPTAAVRLSPVRTVTDHVSRRIGRVINAIDLVSFHSVDPLKDFAAMQFFAKKSKPTLTFGAVRVVLHEVLARPVVRQPDGTVCSRVGWDRVRGLVRCGFGMIAGRWVCCQGRCR